MVERHGAGKSRTKSLKRKIILAMVLLVTGCSVALGSIGSVLNFLSSMNTLQKTMTTTALVAADRVQAQMQAYLNIAYEAGCTSALSSPMTSISEKRELIDGKAKAHQFLRGNTIGLDGISIIDGQDYNDREYFQASLRGETAVSDPVISKITGKLTVLISAPIWERGIANSKVVGVVYFVPTESFLNDIVKSINIGTTGSAFIVSQDGTTIAHEDDSKVGTDNIIKMAETEPALRGLAEVEKKNGFRRKWI